jgi:hypothetical protein
LNDENQEKFEQLSEGRTNYFVEYHPPKPGHKFSILNLVLSGQLSDEAIYEAVESELQLWLGRYPYPLMLQVFSEVEDLIPLPTYKGAQHLLAWKATSSMVHSVSTDLRSSDFENELIKCFPNRFRVFDGLKYQTAADRQIIATRAVRQQKQFSRVMYALSFLWLLAIPAIWVVYLSFAPIWVAILATLYGLAGILWRASRVLKWRQPTSSEIELMAESTLMRHHHYHCKLNPKGFARIKSENFARELEAQNRKKHEELRKSQDKI